jgi:hypothetical protein
MDCFDADALIYAAVPGHPLGRRVAAERFITNNRDFPAGLSEIRITYPTDLPDPAA